MEFGMEKCAMLTMRFRKKNITGMELPNQERMLGKKETYKYSEILEDTKQSEMVEKKKKKKKCISEEQENYLKAKLYCIPSKG